MHIYLIKRSSVMSEKYFIDIEILQRNSNIIIIIILKSNSNDKIKLEYTVKINGYEIRI